MTRRWCSGRRRPPLQRPSRSNPDRIEKWPINRRWTAGRAFIDQKPVHIETSRREAADSPTVVNGAPQGHRSILSVPLLREKESVGAIVLRRTEVHPFSDKQIGLLQTFADQAVIAASATSGCSTRCRPAPGPAGILDSKDGTATSSKSSSRRRPTCKPVLEATLDRSAEIVRRNPRNHLFEGGRRFPFRAARTRHINPAWLDFLKEIRSDRPGMDRRARNPRATAGPSASPICCRPRDRRMPEGRELADADGPPDLLRASGRLREDER